MDNWAKTLACGLSLLIGAQPLASSTQEENFWSERRRHAQIQAKGVIQTAWAKSPGVETPAFQETFNSIPEWGPRTASSVLATSLPSTPPAFFSKIHGALWEKFSRAPGTVRKITAPSEFPRGTVVHIQDVHGNWEAQSNIAFSLQELLDPKDTSGKHPIGLVGLEGAFEPLGVERARQYPDREAMSNVSEALLRENRLSGAAHAALTAPFPIPPFLGVDDVSLHRAHVSRYQRAAVLRPAVKNALDQWGVDIERRKKSAFSQALMEFDRSVELYRTQRSPFQAYVRALCSPFPTSLPPTVRTLQKLIDLESNLDFDRVEEERSVLVKRLVTKMSPAQTKALLNGSMAFRSGRMKYGQFYALLERLCRESGVDLSQTPQFKRYVGYALQADGMDAESLWRELGDLEEQVYGRLAQTAEEKKLAAESREHHLLGKLVDFSLTPEEWSEYKNSPRGRRGGWSESLPSFEGFYQEAERRDVAMAENLLKAMAQTKTQTAIFVSGGFHGPGVDRVLKKAGMAVVTFVPKIEKGEVEDAPTALSVFAQGKTPLERLFQGEKLFLADAPLKPYVLRRLLPAGVVAEKEIADPNAPVSNPEALFAQVSGDALPVTSRDTREGGAEVVVDGKVVVSFDSDLAPQESIRPVSWVQRLKTIFHPRQGVGAAVGTVSGLAKMLDPWVKRIHPTAAAQERLGKIIQFYAPLVESFLFVVLQEGIVWGVSVFFSTGVPEGTVRLVVNVALNALFGYGLHRRVYKFENGSWVLKDATGLDRTGLFGRALLFHAPYLWGITAWSWVFAVLGHIGANVGAKFRGWAAATSAPSTGTLEEASVIRARPKASVYSDADRFAGVDIEHYIHAQDLLVGRQFSPELLKSVLTEMGLSDTWTGDMAYQALYAQWFRMEDVDRLRRVIDLINGESYKDPRLIDTVVEAQNTNPRAQSFEEAVANSLDALGMDLGQFGMGMKQGIDWLEANGQDTLRVWTVREGQFYRLTLIKAPNGQIYIETKVLEESVFREESGLSSSTGTVLRVDVRDKIPETENDLDLRRRNSQDGLMKRVRKAFSFVPGIRITTQKGEESATPVNGFAEKKMVVSLKETNNLIPWAGEIQVRVGANFWSVMDNGRGMGAETLLRMFVPKRGVKSSTPREHLEIVHDPSLPAGVTFSRYGRGIETRPIPENLTEGAVVSGGLQVELGRAVAVDPSWERVLIQKKSESNQRSDFEEGVLELVNKIVASDHLDPVEKIRYINTVIVGVEGLVQGNDYYARVSKRIQQEARTRMAPLLKSLGEKGVVFLPHEKAFDVLAFPPETTVVRLHERLFEWKGVSSLSVLKPQIIPGITASDRPVVLLPFKEGLLDRSLSVEPGWAQRWEEERPVLDTDRFVAVPTALGGRFLQLATRRANGDLSKEEERDFNADLQKLEILITEKVDTSYSLVAPPKALALLPGVRKSVGEIDSTAVNGFLVAPPVPGDDRIPKDAGQRLLVLENGDLVEIGTGRKHGSDYSSVQYLSNGYYLLVGNDLGSGKKEDDFYEIRRFIGGTMEHVWGNVEVAPRFSPNQQYGYFNNALYDFKSGEIIYRNEGEQNKSDRVFFTSDNKYCVVVSDQRIKIIDVMDRKLKGDFDHQHELENIRFDSKTGFIYFPEDDSSNLWTLYHAPTLFKFPGASNVHTDASGQYTVWERNEKLEVFIHSRPNIGPYEPPRSHRFRGVGTVGLGRNPIPFFVIENEEGKTKIKLLSENQSQNENQKLEGLGEFYLKGSEVRYGKITLNQGKMGIKEEEAKRSFPRSDSPFVQHPHLNILVHEAGPDKSTLLDLMNDLKFSVPGKILDYRVLKDSDPFLDSVTVRYQNSKGEMGLLALTESGREGTKLGKAVAPNLFVLDPIEGKSGPDRDDFYYFLPSQSPNSPFSELKKVSVRHQEFPQVQFDGTYYVFSNPKSGEVLYLNPEGEKEKAEPEGVRVPMISSGDLISKEFPKDVPKTPLITREMRSSEGWNPFRVNETTILYHKEIPDSSKFLSLYQVIVESTDASAELLQAKFGSFPTRLYDIRNGWIVADSMDVAVFNGRGEGPTGVPYSGDKLFGHSIKLSATGRFSIHEVGGSAYLVDNMNQRSYSEIPKYFNGTIEIHPQKDVFSVRRDGKRMVFDMENYPDEFTGSLEWGEKRFQRFLVGHSVGYTISDKFPEDKVSLPDGNSGRVNKSNTALLMKELNINIIDFSPPSRYKILYGDKKEKSLEGILPADAVYVDTLGDYFVFETEKGEVLYLDSRKIVGGGSVSNAAGPEWEALVKFWKGTVLPLREGAIAQARAAYGPMLSLFPEEWKQNLTQRIQPLIEKLYAVQDKAIQDRLEDLKRSGRLSGLPFDVFSSRMEEIQSHLEKFLQSPFVQEIGNEKPEFQRGFYVRLFEGVFHLAQNSGMALDQLSPKHLKTLGLGWSIDSQAQWETMGAVTALLAALQTQGEGLPSEALQRFVSALSEKTARDPPMVGPIVVGQIQKILTAPPAVQQTFLREIQRAFSTNDEGALTGRSLRFLEFFTQSINPVRERNDIPLVGEAIPLPGGRVRLSQLMQLELNRPKNDETGGSLMSMDYLIANLSTLPQPVGRLESEILRDFTTQSEPGSYAREIAQNALDATEGRAGQLVVDMYLRPGPKGELEFVEEATDNGDGAEKEPALLIPHSTKAKGAQETQRGFFGMGKYTILEGVDRQEIITKHNGQAYLFTLEVEKDNHGNPIGLWWTGLRRLTDERLKEGVTQRRVKKVENTIPELDQALAEEVWGDFAGLAQKPGRFDILRVKADGSQVPLVIQKEVLALGPLVSVDEKGEPKTFGTFQLVSTPDHSVKTTDGSGLRVGQINPAFWGLVPEALRKDLKNLSVSLKIPLPLILSRSGFKQENRHLPALRVQLAVAFYQALARRALSTSLDRPFVFTGLPDEWWNTTIGGDGDAHIVKVAQKINEGRAAELTEADMSYFLENKTSADLERYVKLVALLEVPVDPTWEEDVPVKKTSSLLKRQLAILEAANKELAERKRRALASNGFVVGESESLRDVPFATHLIDQFNVIESAKNPENYIVKPENLNPDEVRFLETARDIAFPLGLEEIYMVEGKFPVGGVFKNHNGKNTIFLNRAIVGGKGRKHDGGTNTIAHELSHLLEELEKGNTGVFEKGFAAHGLDFTHQPVGVFGWGMQKVAARWLLQGETPKTPPTEGSPASEDIPSTLAWFWELFPGGKNAPGTILKKAPWELTSLVVLQSVGILLGVPLFVTPLVGALAGLSHAFGTYTRTENGEWQRVSGRALWAPSIKKALIWGLWLLAWGVGADLLMPDIGSGDLIQQAYLGALTLLGGGLTFKAHQAANKKWMERALRRNQSLSAPRGVGDLILDQIDGLPLDLGVRAMDGRGRSLTQTYFSKTPWETREPLDVSAPQGRGTNVIFIDSLESIPGGWARLRAFVRERPNTVIVTPSLPLYGLSRLLGAQVWHRPKSFVPLKDENGNPLGVYDVSLQSLAPELIPLLVTGQLQFFQTSILHLNTEGLSGSDDLRELIRSAETSYLLNQVLRALPVRFVPWDDVLNALRAIAQAA